MSSWMLLPVLLLLLVGCPCSWTLGAAAASSSGTLPLLAKGLKKSRRCLNLASTFGSVTTQATTPYDRVSGHPVFCVTTAWGSPYMNMEKLTDLDETVPTTTASDSSKKAPTSLSEEQAEYRMVALYFMDPSDALAVLGEMKQMENMEKSDIRITSFSLSKALRQASNLGYGLPTGMALDPATGALPMDDGGALRYKIVPPKRQLYYAARCAGKERVGLWSTATVAANGAKSTPLSSEDAITAILGNSALEAANLARRRDKRERKTKRAALPVAQAKAAHMEGYTGVPVFYCSELQRRLPFVKQVTTGCRQETPLFFNYEDLQTAWASMKERKAFQKGSIVPLEPVVEVFNLWDVLVSMDLDKSVRGDWKRDPVAALKRRLFLTKEEPSLQDITFVPNSASVLYKDEVSRRGNSKARLRSMRDHNNRRK